MKKVWLVTLLVCIWTTGGVALAANRTESKKKEPRKEKTQRDEQRALAAAQDSLLYEIALRAIKDQDFVVEVDKVTFKRGEITYLNSSTNFISLHNERATVQLSFPFAHRSGPNGLGGITVDGHPSGIELKQDRKGNPYFSMNVAGNGISAEVTVSMYKGSNKAVVRVTPNFNSNVITLNGLVVPYGDSSVYKGRPL